MKALIVVVSFFISQFSLASNNPSETINHISKNFSQSQICKGDFLTNGLPKCTTESLIACATKNLKVAGIDPSGNIMETYVEELGSQIKLERAETYAEGFAPCLQYSSLVLMVPINKWIE